MKRPDISEKQYSIEDLWSTRKVADSTKSLFRKFDKEVRTIDDEIWAKVARTVVSYYAPERVFLYTWFRENTISFDLFTRGQEIEGVHYYGSSAVVRWGWIRLEKETGLPKVLEAVRRSHQLIREAIRANEPTGWYSKVEEEFNAKEH